MVYVLHLPKRWEVLNPSPHRHNKVPKLVGHRFEVKNGLDWREVRRLYPEQAKQIQDRGRAALIE